MNYIFIALILYKYFIANITSKSTNLKIYILNYYKNKYYI